MKNLAILVLFLMLFSCSNKRQNDNKDVSLQTDDANIEIAESIIEEECEEISDVFYVVEEMPNFGNEWEDIRKYILDNIDYPQTAIIDSIEGKVYIQFVINEKGKVIEVRVIRRVSDDLVKESLRVVNGMCDWKPGKQRDVPVKVWYTLPFCFQLDSDSEKTKGNITSPKTKTEDKSIVICRTK